MERESEVEILRQQLVQSARAGQSLLLENSELKQRSAEDAEQLGVLRQQLAKLEELNRRIVAESADELTMAQKQDVAQIDELKKCVSEQRQELIETRQDRNRLRDDLDDEKRRAHESKVAYETAIEEKDQRLDDIKQRPQVNTDAHDAEIQMRKQREIELRKELESKSKSLQEQHNELVVIKRAMHEMKQNLESVKQEKNEIERENTRLSEQNDDLQLEIQLAQSSMKSSVNAAPDIETQGNSLFSEVEDQRAKTASELRVLEETYRSKIHRFDELEKELQQKRNENNELWFKVSSSVATEAKNERLINELRVLREERDSLISATFSGSTTSTTDVQHDNDKLRQQLREQYVLKNIQHDHVRRLNEQLSTVEKENARLKHDQRQSRMARLGMDENAEPAVKCVEQVPRVSALGQPTKDELPSDEDHRKAIEAIEEDVAEQNCKQQ